MTDTGKQFGALCLREVSYSYRRSPRAALDGVNLSVSTRSLAVLGPNGAGKSTLFRLITTASAPASGSITFNGLSLELSGDREYFRRNLGVMPQSLRMFGGYRSADFLRYVCWLRQVPANLIESAVRDSLATVDLESQSDQKIKTMSGGMRQRLGLAQAFVARPQVVVLDEPTVGLDPAQRVDFRRYLQEVKQRCTIVLATHLVDDVAAVSEDVLVLSKGRSLFAGSLGLLVGNSHTGRITGGDVESAYLSLAPESD